MKHEDLMQKPRISLEDAIIELYLNVKIRKQEDIDHYSASALDAEKDMLKKTNPITLIGYIKKSIEILIDLKVQERLHDRITNQDQFANRYGNEEGINEYEPLLRKCEADIRNYIKIEHQLKLHAEAMQIKNEELERIIEEMKRQLNYCEGTAKPGKLNDGKYSEEKVESYKKEIAHLQQIIKSYEQHNLKIPVLEKKLRNQKIEMKNMDSFYKKKLRSYSKRLERYEEVIKSGNAFNTSQLTSSDMTTKAGSRNNIIENTSITSKTTRKREEETNNISSSKIKSEQFRKITGKILNGNIKANVGGLKLIKTKEVNSNIDRENEISMKITESKVNLTGRDNTIDFGKYRERERDKCDFSEIQSSRKAHRRIDSLSFITNPPENLSTVMPSKRIDSILVDNKSRGPSHDTRTQLEYVGNAASNSKSIHSMMVKEKEKDIAKSSQRGLSTNQNIGVKHPQIGNPHTGNNINLNQQGVPCFNNINIFTGGINNVKAGDINLRQFIFSKIGSTKKKQIGRKIQQLNSTTHNNIPDKLVHARSTSALGNK